MCERYSIMIVEDETAIAQSLVRKLQEFSKCFYVLGLAYNGREALNKIRELGAPDIVISDIVMPEMDGLAMIEEAKTLCPNTQFILLSGYDEFEYAKSAIALGIREYLLKPVSTAALEATLSKLRRILEEQRTTVFQPQLYSLLHGVPSEQILSLYVGKKFALLFLCTGNYYPQYADNDTEDFFNALWEEIRIPDFKAQDGETLYKIHLVCALHANERYILIEWMKGIEAHLTEIAATLVSVFEQKNIPLSIAYAQLPAQPKEIYKVARSLRKLCISQCIPWRSAIYSYNAADSQAFARESIRAVESGTVSVNLAAGNLSAARQALYNLMSQWLAWSVSVSQFWQNLLFVFSSLRYTAHAESETQWMRFLRETHAVFCFSGNYEAFFDECWSLFLHYFLESIPDSSLAAVVQKVKRYIDENYMKQISIFSIARNFGISTSYLAREFKEACGLSPVNYIIHCRIEEAKRLMRENPTMQMQTVSVAIGYPDQHYFSKLFKKISGMTPSEYRSTTAAVIVPKET